MRCSLAIGLNKTLVVKTLVVKYVQVLPCANTDFVMVGTRQFRCGSAIRGSGCLTNRALGINLVELHTIKCRGFSSHATARRPGQKGANGI